MGFLHRADEAPRLFCTCVVAAAGASERMGEDKLFLRLGDSVVICKTLRALQSSPYIDEIIVVTRSESIPVIAALGESFGVTKLTHLVTGGESRAESVLRGVELCGEKTALIAVHDGARPLVDEDTIERAVLAAMECGAAAPAVRVKDTVRVARGGMAVKTLERDELYLMQTPQVFEVSLLRNALEEAVRLHVSVTDDCQAVMLRDAPVRITEGSCDNLKITTPTDIITARAILEERGEWTC